MAASMTIHFTKICFCSPKTNCTNKKIQMCRLLLSYGQRILAAHKRLQILQIKLLRFHFAHTTCSILRTIAQRRIFKQSLLCRAVAEIRSLAMSLVSTLKMEISTTDAADATQTCSQFLRKYIGVSDSLSQKSDLFLSLVQERPRIIVKCSVGVPLEAVPGIARNDQTDLFLDQAALNEGMEGSAEHQNDRNERL